MSATNDRVLWRRDREPLQYDWCGGPKEIQFYFTVPGFGEHGRASILVSPEVADAVASPDEDEIDRPAFDVVTQIKDQIERRYLWSSKRADLDGLLAYLGPRQDRDWLAAKRVAVERAESQLATARERLRLAEQANDSEGRAP